MYYYTVPTIAVEGRLGGTSIQPAIPDGTPFVGQLIEGTYLIATPSDLTGVEGVTDVSSTLEATATSMGIPVEYVQKWTVG